jgi:thiol-disulfide isomerase/thioredoxin
MKRILLLCLLATFACKEYTDEVTATEIEDVEREKKQVVEDISDIDLKVYDYDGLEPLIHINDDKIHVVNFWATWCAPCVKELPYFEDINKNYKSKGVEVLLVSLDFPKNYESKLKPFIKKYDLKSKVVAFDDIDQNRWIPAINKKWSGALPATIMYKGDKRQFYEQSFTKEELENELKQFLN